MDPGPRPPIEDEVELGDRRAGARDDPTDAPWTLTVLDADPDLEDVTRLRRPPEARPMDPDQRHVLVAERDRSELCHRLAQEHAGKHRGPRKMPREVRIVRPDQLRADSRRPRLDVHQPVDEGERKPPRPDHGFAEVPRVRDAYSPPAARFGTARLGFALCILITSSVMSTLLSLYSNAPLDVSITSV